MSSTQHPTSATAEIAIAGSLVTGVNSFMTGDTAVRTETFLWALPTHKNVLMVLATRYTVPLLSALPTVPGQFDIHVDQTGKPSGEMVSLPLTQRFLHRRDF